MRNGRYTKRDVKSTEIMEGRMITMTLKDGYTIEVEKGPVWMVSVTNPRPRQPFIIDITISSFEKDFRAAYFHECETSRKKIPREVAEKYVSLVEQGKKRLVSKGQHGGYREGAGRPVEGNNRSVFTIRVDNDEKKMIKHLVQAYRKMRGEEWREFNYQFYKEIDELENRIHESRMI